MATPLALDLSVVVPAYNEVQNLEELVRRLLAVLSAITLQAEVLFVNDGSKDGSAELLDALALENPTTRVVHLSRNFGHQAAVAAGLNYARGRAVVVIDADLQDPPELIPLLVAKWREGYQIVYAQRTVRHGDPVTKRLLAWGYYRVVRRLAGVDLPLDAGDFCLMDRVVVDQLTSMPEHHRYIRGLRAWVGFRQTGVPFKRAPRYAGDAKYTFRKSLALAMNGVFSLSTAPLRAASWLGLVISTGTFCLALWAVLRKLAGATVSGWASLVVIVLFLGGVQLLTIGIIGEYLGRVYDEVKRRPIYVVARLTSRAGGDDSASGVLRQ